MSPSVTGREKNIEHKFVLSELSRRGGVLYWLQLASYLLYYLLFIINCCEANESIAVLANDVSRDEKKFLIYDVNYGEGFNLRRDVFMRIANTVRILRERGYNYVLVLPPWGGLYHWRKHHLKVPWSKFFHIQSINEFVPVIEFHRFLKETNYDVIDEVLYLQGYAEGWTGGKYEIKYDQRNCIINDPHYKFIGGLWKGWFFSFENIYARKFSCISIQGDSETLANMIQRDHHHANSLMIDRAETVLHSHFGDFYYWEARRSMRYAEHLRLVADEFRQKRLNSNDRRDGTLISDSWKTTRKEHGEAQGGDYICVHWRRRDFVRSHSADIPSISGTAEQIVVILRKENLTTLYLCTDASTAEVATLTSLLPYDVQVERFLNDSSLNDGEVSIVDQWICAHARYFIGTHTSTFSYRIQEDREILGFEPAKTFNRLCPDGETDCEQPAKWTIVYKESPSRY
uniref:GDP-fucose protein O-fucosyltransferase 2 n=1 Tax=Brugia malayi TaxID=6279 RepID=A0A0H5SBG0_BRUMA|nr:BMA-PAD-2 [Brugia malayi]